MKKNKSEGIIKEVTLEDYNELLKFGCDDPLNDFKIKDVEYLILKEDEVHVHHDECYYLIQDIIEDTKIAFSEE